MVSKLKKLFGRKPRITREQAMVAFHRRYASFKELLQANADLAGILAGLNATQQGERHMETSQVRKEARRAIFRCDRMATTLNDISNQRHQDLHAALQNIAKRIEKELDQRASGDVPTLTLDLIEIDASMAYSVGGKNANLGELRNMLDMPVPRGFAITIRAGSIFLLRTPGLFKSIYSLLRSIDPEKPDSINAIARQVEQIICEAPVPQEVEEALLKAWDLAYGDDPQMVAALRSSAIAEDGVQSFAGQYRSLLGVTRNELIPAFKAVVASLFSPRALAYRSEHGYALDATGMGLCCLEMVRSRAAGVAFSRHPVDLRSNSIVINGLWGLGEMVVDGSGTPDQWLVSRATGKITKATIAHKAVRLRLVRTEAGVESELTPVPEDLQDVPCLSDDQVRQLADMVMQLERHYQYPQDMEWAVDEDDQIVLLQTRPMGLDSMAEEKTAPILGHLRPLLSGADVAARGVGCGPVVFVGDGEDITHFPEGAVMLMDHSSPSAMSVMRRASAIIAQTGSLTGHMASICREFGVPTLMNIPGVTGVLAAGQVVTVDALMGRIFDGEVPELLALRLTRPQVRADSPALMLLRRITPYILPLHLVDPRADTFTPKHCTSLHDIMRYAHEMSYSEMFKISDSVTDNSAGVASELVSSIPLDLYVIDLGGGLRNPESRRVHPDDVTSVPFRHVLDGMLNPAVQARGPRPINMRGFLSVMGQSVIGGNQEGSSRFGQRSYAIVSDRYLNFSSRVGYHYAILDTWCGESLSKNYIRFEFAGGAASDEQRVRRVRCIGMILKELGFTVELTGDRIRARYQKYPKPELCARLDQLGRLLIMTRQMDMLMVDEAAVAACADKFLKGEYH
ncbi:MAG: PEP/pyruvate-binding domain-containing protein [Desulfovibrio sp.]|uniref:PEP/pyruvate-binding domain-containing protein n=1 Tax=Desulfovibrio sp. TaxID=885 RepID=UPI002A36D59E|nr:PEP/pyruvate-binding domain-containing protein [Desulfovibrio sp.]MDY0259655.1 PEP/pyruvate-binding domain-containing protein [Desulfovibrio sp.]